MQKDHQRHHHHVKFPYFFTVQIISIIQIIIIVQLLFTNTVNGRPLYPKTEEELIYETSVHDPIDRAMYIADIKQLRMLRDITLEDPIHGGEQSNLNWTQIDTQGRTLGMKCGLDPQLRKRNQIDNTCTRIMKLLNGMGMDFHHKDHYGWNLIAHLSVGGFTETIKFLAQNHSVDIHSEDGSFRTPLFKTVINGFIKTTKLLLELGSDPNHFDNSGWTPLTYCIRNSKQPLWREMAIVLLEHGAMPNLYDIAGRTPISYASGMGQWEMIDILLKYGADIHQTDGNGLSAISWAANKETLDYLHDKVITNKMERFDKWDDDTHNLNNHNDYQQPKIWDDQAMDEETAIKQMQETLQHLTKVSSGN